MPNPQNLIGQGFHTNPERINRAGRPRKYVSQLKEIGYNLAEINDTIQVMMALTLKDLIDIRAKDESTILEKTIANAMITSLKKGSLYSLETLLSRVYGKPKEQTEINQDGKIEIVFVKGKTIL